MSMKLAPKLTAVIAEAADEVVLVVAVVVAAVVAAAVAVAAVAAAGGTNKPVPLKNRIHNTAHQTIAAKRELNTNWAILDSNQ